MLRNIVLTFGPFRLAFAPEIERVHGELLLRRDQRDEAERGFRRALEIARARGERALELRAATSLARLLAQSKRADEARPILAGVHGRARRGARPLTCGPLGPCSNSSAASGRPRARPARNRHGKRRLAGVRTVLAGSPDRVRLARHRGDAPAPQDAGRFALPGRAPRASRHQGRATGAVWPEVEAGQAPQGSRTRPAGRQ
jgi:Tetratricopeptide repeat